MSSPPPSPTLVRMAAVMCAIDDETDETIAARLGISRRTLVSWKKRPEFIAARDEFTEQAVGELERRLI
jgi:hypothetical protein